MTNPAESCISRAELERYQAGSMPEDRCGQVDDHLRVCDRCRNEIESMLAENESLLTRLRTVQRESDETGTRLFEFLKQVDPAGTLRTDDLVEHDADYARALSDSVPLADPGNRGSAYAGTSRHGEAMDTVSTAPAGTRDPDNPTENARDVPEGKRYRLIRKLGKGGMGQVVLARDVLLERDVAIKRISDTKASEMLLREARAVAQLQHPHIVPIYDVVRDGDADFIIMEFLEGGDLRQVVLRGERLPLRRVLRIGVDLCDALAYAQQRGITHRDVKPSNVLIGQNAAVKIADFGVALNRRHNPDPVDIAGTAHYMAPEVAAGRQGSDESADVYSLGVTLYELATLQLPNEQSHTSQYRGLPPRVQDVLSKAYAPNRGERFENFHALMHALQELEKELQQESNAIHCRVCGQELEPEIDCTTCRTSKELLTIHCGSCDRVLDLEHDTCVACGSDVQSDAARKREILQAVLQVRQPDWRKALDTLRRHREQQALPAQAVSVLTQLEERQSRVARWKIDAEEARNAGKLHESLEYWERIAGEDVNHPDARKTIERIENELGDRRVAVIVEEIEQKLGDDEIEAADELVDALQAGRFDSDALDRIRERIKEHKRELLDTLRREGIELFRKGEFYAALLKLDRAFSFSTDNRTREMLSRAIRVAEQRERLQRANEHLDRQDESAAQQVLEQIRNEYVSGEAVDQLQSCRARLEALKLRRRLRRLGIRGAMAIAAVLIFGLLLPWFTASMTTWSHDDDARRSATVRQAINQKLAEAADIVDPETQSHITALALKLAGNMQATGKASNNQQTRNPNPIDSVAPGKGEVGLAGYGGWFKRFEETAFGAGRARLLRAELARLVETENENIDRDIRQSADRVIHSLAWHEHSLAAFQKAGTCRNLSCDNSMNWLETMLTLAQREPAESGARPIGSRLARNSLESLSRWLREVPDQTTQNNTEELEHAACRKVAGRLGTLQDIDQVCTTRSCDVLLSAQERRTIRDTWTSRRSALIAEMLDRHTQKLRDYDTPHLPAAVLLDRWQKELEAVRACPVCRESINDGTAGFYSLGNAYSIMAGIEEGLENGAEPADLRSLLQALRRHEYVTENPDRFERYRTIIESLSD